MELIPFIQLIRILKDQLKDLKLSFKREMLLTQTSYQHGALLRKSSFDIKMIKLYEPHVRFKSFIYYNTILIHSNYFDSS